MSLKEIDIILNSSYSNTAQIILIKSLRLPKNWKWKREWIMNFFRLTDHQWRNISNELKDAGNLTHHYRQKEGKIVKEIMITFRLDEFQQDESICAEIPRLDGDRLDGEQRIYKSSTIVIPDSKAESTLGAHCLDGEQQDGDPHQKLWDNIPAELRELNQWVYWRYDKIDGRDTKVPYCAKNKKAKSNDSKTWLNFVGAMNYKNIGMAGIGLVLTEADPYIVIDLDKCIDAGKPNKYSVDVMGIFMSYAEISPSGKGLHIVIKGKLQKAISTKEIEVYSKGRYICFTGNLAWDYKIKDGQGGIDRIEKKLGPKPESAKPYPKNFKDNGEYTLPKKLFPDGNRNNELVRQCGVIKTKIGNDKNKYMYWVYRVNEKCCSPPLGEMEVKRTAEKLWRL